MFEIIKKLGDCHVTSLMNFAKTTRATDASAEERIEARASIYAYCRCLYNCDVLNREEFATLCDFMSDAKDDEFAWFVKFMD